MHLLNFLISLLFYCRPGNLTASPDQSRAFDGAVGKPFKLNQEPAFARVPRWNLGSGHSNLVCAVRANGQDSSLGHLDDETTVDYGMFAFAN